MIVHICDDYPYYYLSEYEGGGNVSVDVTQKFKDRYDAFVTEMEFIQSKLHRYYTEGKAQQKLNNSKDRIKPIGF